MSWSLWFLPLALLCLLIAALLRRRAELRTQRDHLAERAVARARGSHQARLQHPAIDLSRCIGCGACVRACPEDGVLGLAYGQAVVLHGARCVGHGRCAEACPTDAISLTLGDLRGRNDLPAVDEQFEAVTVPGLFLAGEITGFALVRTAVHQGTSVARTIAARIGARSPAPAPTRVVAAVGAGSTAIREREPAPGVDLLIVGMGPAGLACALAARERGLRFLCLEQAHEIGGTVAAYPRSKLVMTQPMDLPLHGRLQQLTWAKEDLVALWQHLVRQHELPVRTGTTVQRVARAADGGFTVHAEGATFRAHHVVLALGRRGSPRKLGVPGEDLGKVAYALLDAASYQDCAILVVGGGDSAVEAALALAEQGTNTVTLSYRKEAFSRLKARNDQRIAQAQQQGSVHVLFGSEVVAITDVAATLRLDVAGQRRTIELPCEHVLVFAGGTPPFPLLTDAGVSFDPALRPVPAPPTDRGTGLLVALSTTLLGLLVLLWTRWQWADYYDLAAAQRPASAWHELLRPQSPTGLWAGIAATALFVVNLLYLLRRNARGQRLPGTLRTWMALHVATGLGALLLAWLHSGFQVRDSVGGHALLAMAVVVGAGIVGRWFYAFVPRAQNGRQSDLEELGSRVTALASEWDRHGRGFGVEVRRHIDDLVTGSQLGQGFCRRVLGLWRSQRRLHQQLRLLRARGQAEGVPAAELTTVLALARRAHRLALQVAHHEELRALLASWRYLHRWLALLLALLVILHVVTAARYGGIDLARLFPGGAR